MVKIKYSLTFPSRKFQMSFSHVKFSLHIWNGNVLTYEIANSYVKLTGSEFRMWNLGIQNNCFTYEMEDSHVKINFTYEIFISQMEYWNNWSYMFS